MKIRTGTMKKSVLVMTDDVVSLVTIEVVAMKPGEWINWDRVINSGEDFWDNLEELDAKRVQSLKESEADKEYNLERMRHLNEQRLTDEQVVEGTKTDPFYKNIINLKCNKQVLSCRGVAARLASKTG